MTYCDRIGHCLSCIEYGDPCCQCGVPTKPKPEESK